MAATRTFVSCERVVPTDALLDEGSEQTIRVSRLWTDGVVEAPYGAHFTHCVPDYPRDEALQRDYAATAQDPDAWAAFRARWVDLPEADYRAAAAASLGAAT
jgi:glutaconate CoA-transferase subunit A